MGLQLRALYGYDLVGSAGQQFFATLSALAPTALSAEDARRIFWRRLGQGWRTIVAIADGQLVGTASLLIEAKFARGGGLVGHIEDVAVLPNRQRQGVGQALVGHLMEMARAEGCYKIILCCAESTVGFYDKCGFQVHGVEMRLDLKITEEHKEPPHAPQPAT